jgi:predicted transcriptional regulator of viral defense system
MPNIPVLTIIKNLKRTIFTTREISSSGAGTLSNTVQALNHLARQGVLFKISKGIWGLQLGEDRISPYAVVPYLLPNHRGYVSFISALHLYGIIEQIPQSITVASTGHTRVIKTKLGTYYIHRIAPEFFKGFVWYQEKGHFLIAEPEKALIDCIYLSVGKKKQFSYFPELRLSNSFNFGKAKKWAREIPNLKIRSSVLKKLERIKDAQ